MFGSLIEARLAGYGWERSSPFVTLYTTTVVIRISSSRQFVHWTIRTILDVV